MDDKHVSIEKLRAKFRPSLLHDPAPFIAPSYRVLFGTFAGMVATTLVQPLDLIKTRLMINPVPHTTFSMAKLVYRKEGLLAFYNGYTAAICRQFFNTGTRLSVYNYLYDKFKRHYKRRPTTYEKVKIGLVAGVAGAMVGGPSEVVLVRMIVSSAPRAYNKCPDLQGMINNRYLEVVEAVQRIIHEEGVKALWRGGTLMIIRSILNTLCQVGAYSVIRDYFKTRGLLREGYSLHVVTSMISSFIFTVTSIPVDIVKTRYQMRRRGITQTQIFKNIIKLRGPFYFWRKPLPSYYFRLTLHTMTSFFVVESIENTYEKEEEEWEKSDSH